MSQPEFVASLPDGSEAYRQRIDAGTSIISRHAYGACVWAQGFSATASQHEGQVAEVIAKMQADPSGFYRWWNGGR